MASVCCVDNCDATSKEDITYFPLPVKPALRRAWISAVGVPRLHPHSLICSQHFAPEDCQLVRGKLRLLANKIPTLFPQRDSTDKPKPDVDTEEANESSDSLSNDKPKRRKRFRKTKRSSKKPRSEDKEESKDNNKEKEDEENKETKENEENHKTDSVDSVKNDSVKDKNVDEKDPKSDNLELDNKSTENKNGDVDNESIVDNLNETDSDNKVNSDVNSQSDNIECCPSIDMLFQVDRDSTDSAEDGVQNCTIECVPEIMAPEDDSDQSEADIHKKDIEDIIANYHIKQDKILAERMKKAQEKESIQQESLKKATVSPPPPPAKPDSDEEVEFVSTNAKPAKFIEISVDMESNATAPNSSDCMMVLENVQVEIDPNVFPEPDEDSSVEELPDKREGAISLLTSSDSDDVILEEPHIDTVEVSDEDEDDVPLVKLVCHERRITSVAQVVWGTYEFYCYQCKFKTTSHSEYHRHKQTHSRIILVCEFCEFTTASFTQLQKHKKKHKDERRFKCHLCDYRAKRKASLAYHIKTHENPKVNVNVVQSLTKHFFRTHTGYKCYKCNFECKTRPEIRKHTKACGEGKMHGCQECDYATARRSDLRRHMMRRHNEEMEDD